MDCYLVPRTIRMVYHGSRPFQGLFLMVHDGFHGLRCDQVVHEGSMDREFISHVVLVIHHE